MIRRLAVSQRVSTGVFGAFCPFWTSLDGEVVVADTAREIYDALPESRRELDPVGLLELLQFNYLLGNRTLVRGVQRMPWRATLHGDGRLERRPPISHGALTDAPERVAARLRSLLEAELIEATRGRRRVYLLLSGGLDSRVVAGILKGIEAHARGPIICVSWGKEGCRDVHYAGQIASGYGWDFVHVPYDADLAWANLHRGADWGGSEVCGLHLHGAHWFSSADPEDLAIAASFGDSIGRAEFSSRHLSELVRPPVANTAGLLHAVLLEPALAAGEADRAAAWEGSPGSGHPWAPLELDMQENYMRRMIGHATDYVRQFCRLHQAFTSEAVVSLMWSLAPGARTNAVYDRLLREIDPRLHALPWARTGASLDGSVRESPDFSQECHDWGEWLHRDLRPRLEELIFSRDLLRLGALDAAAVRGTWAAYRAEPSERLHWAHLVAKLASVELFRRRFRIRPCRRPTLYSDAFRDLARRTRNRARRLVRQPPS